MLYSRRRLGGGGGGGCSTELLALVAGIAPSQSSTVASLVAHSDSKPITLREEATVRSLVVLDAADATVSLVMTAAAAARCDSPGSSIRLNHVSIPKGTCRRNLSRARTSATQSRGVPDTAHRCVPASLHAISARDEREDEWDEGNAGNEDADEEEEGYDRECTAGVMLPPRRLSTIICASSSTIRCQ